MIINDDIMKERLGKAKPYTVVILKKTEIYSAENSKSIVWEHGRKNFQLREDGLLPIVIPIIDGSVYSGIGIFNADIDKVKEIMNDDPGVKAGIFSYEIHAGKGFPGSLLP